MIQILHNNLQIEDQQQKIFYNDYGMQHEIILRKKY